MKKLLVTIAMGLFCGAGIANAAAPPYIMVSGPRLARPILLSDWEQNHELLLSIANSRPARRTRGVLVGRPKFDIALFWGWPAGETPKSPRDASAHGTFYPSHRGRRPLVRVTVNGTSTLRVASATVLRILREHRVPVAFPRSRTAASASASAEAFSAAKRSHYDRPPSENDQWIVTIRVDGRVGVSDG